ncbi:Splicing factor 3B subunit 4 [Camellia lanceoleosa]|uniref:Splicing factor 3B subunit 4 n=1 Tax=Camellia lanceoleosa TaxID=1840588 RepID=A0ACC0GMY3_9ERIC|nr:Splicing factor 3B subunit 4 [Camellia lanceoleosa]
MSANNSACKVYIGNLDERVSDRVLYDILIQAGRVVDLYIPKDKETDRRKGFAFAEYETEEIASYAVRLFSGLVTLYNRTLKFAISGQDKPSPNLSTATTPMLNSSPKVGPPPVPFNNVESQHSERLSTSCRFSEQPINHGQVRPGVVHQSNGYRSHFDGNNYDYNRRVFGATMDSINRSRSSRFDSSVPINYPYY